MRVQGVALEHHGEVALLGALIEYGASAGLDVPLVRLLDAGDQVDRGGLSRARRAEQREQLAGLYREVKLLYRRDLAVGFGDSLEGEFDAMPPTSSRLS
jgi:hypothetical protein